MQIQRTTGGDLRAPRLFTSYWSNKALADVDAVKVGVSRGTPRWPLPYSYRVLRTLAPSREAFALKDPDEFTVAYRAGLDEIGVEKIVSDLTRIAQEGGGEPLALLCWERPGEFCHRRILADWLHEHAGVEVPELRPGMLPDAEREETPEPRLF